MIQEGDLVQCEGGRLGIVLGVSGYDTEVLFSDDREIISTRGIRIVENGNGESVNFIEMVKAYKTCRGFN